MASWICKSFDLFRGPFVFRAVWHLLARVSRLTGPEIEAASGILGGDAIRYSVVRVAEGRLLRLIFRLNNNRAFTTFHTINLPAKGSHTRPHLDILLHELVHVYQFERIGSLYIWQALRAQRTEGHDFGGWTGLAEERGRGKRLKDFNREQQGKIVESYYNDVVQQHLPEEHPERAAFEPYIGDLRAGEL